MTKTTDRIGESSKASNGQLMTIIDYRNYSDIDVQFEDGFIVKGVSYYNFTHGIVKNPNLTTHNITVQKYAKQRIGEVNTNKYGQKMTIIAYRDCGHIDVKFDDGAIAFNASYFQFKNGTVLNPDCRYTKEKERIGESIVANNGQKMTIIAYRGATDIDVEFDDGTVLHEVSYSAFKSGRIGETKHKREIRKQRVGEEQIANNGQKMTIIRYKNSRDIDVRFEDGIEVYHRDYFSFKKGLIANPEYKKQ